MRGLWNRLAGWYDRVVVLRMDRASYRDLLDAVAEVERD